MGGRPRTWIPDALFTALSDRYRRRILCRLLEHDPEETLSMPEEIHRGATDLETLETMLYHTHLPKLEEMGFIYWDRKANIIRPGPQFDEIRPYLDVIYSHRDKLPDQWD